MPQQLLATGRRTDIQGLRTIAVLAVLLFHIGGWLGGGYIGVDVFFVISGYVIALAYQARFIAAPSVVTAFDFFRRRILRLAPALIIVIVATLIVTTLSLPPSESKLAAIRAGFSAMTQTSNILFASLKTNYWLDTLSRNPFLHTWSLGVEWQFYALFPLPFLVGRLIKSARPKLDLARYSIAAVVTLVAASLLVFLTSDATRAFYGPWSRFWQFALGILAFVATKNLSQSRMMCRFYPALLIALILLTALPPTLLDQKWGSILSSLATAALLGAAPSASSPVVRMLGSHPFQAIGAASYSIYLTHWPIAVYGRLLLGEGLECDVALLVASLASGFLLSKTIEYRLVHTARPMRAAIACLAVVGLAGVGAASQRIIPRLPWYAAPPLVSRVDGFHNFWWTEVEGGRNSYGHAATFRAGDLYRRLVPGLDLYEARAVHSSNAGEIVGVGNSYIQSAGAMLRRYASDHGAGLQFFQIANCTNDNEARCRRAFAYTIGQLEREKHRIAILYVAFRGLDGSALVARNVAELMSRIEHPGLRVVIQGPSPDFAFDPVGCLRLFRPCRPTESRATDVAALDSAEQRLSILFGGRPRLSIWSPYKDLCSAGTCIARDGGANIVIDNDHFSIAGQAYLYPHLRRHLAEP